MEKCVALELKGFERVPFFPHDFVFRLEGCCEHNFAQIREFSTPFDVVFGTFVA